MSLSRPLRLVTLRNADPRLAFSDGCRSRSTYDARFHVAENTTPTLAGDSPDSGPPRNRLPCPQVSSRLIAGADPSCVPAFSEGNDAPSSTPRVHTFAVGRLGRSVTAMP